MAADRSALPSPPPPVASTANRLSRMDAEWIVASLKATSRGGDPFPIGGGG